MRSKRAFINILSSLLLQIITILCGLVIPRMIIGSYGSAVNGLVSSITQFLGYIALLEAGVGPVVKSVLYKPIAENNKDLIQQILKSSENFFRKIAYIFIMYIIALCLFFPILMQEQFNILFTLSLVIIISISTFSEYYFGMTYRLYLEADQKTYIISFIQVSTYILNTIVVVTLIYIGSSIQVVKLTSAFIFILRPLLQNLYVKRKYNISFKNIDKEFNLPQKWDGLAQHIAAVVHNNTDITILILFSNAKIVSVYSVYLLVVNGVKNIILSFSSGMDASFGNMIANNENENLNKNFRIYELFYFTIVTIIFSLTLLLIIPFIKIYTLGITDVNYIIPAFGYLMVIGEFIWSIRQPYNELVKAAGHFKETRNGAWVEAGINIFVSVILVMHFGIIGVAIGTLIAMIIRTFEFMYYSSKYILKRRISIVFKKLIVIILQVVTICLLSVILPAVEITSFFQWFIYAFEIFILSTFIVICSNILVYKEERKGLLNLIKHFKKR